MPPLIHIVDDDSQLRAALKGLLRSMDFDTMEHGSIETFLRANKSERPGCVLVDVRLPDGNGLDLQARMIAEGVRQQRCQVNRCRPQLAQPDEISSHSRSPSGRGLGAEAAKCGAADEMSLGVEGVVDRGVGGEEALG